jgi:DNA-binding protein HU-beta
MSNNVTKADLISSIAAKAEITKADAEKVLRVTLAEIQEALSNGLNVPLVGFGTFTTVKREERVGRNPQTGKEMTIPASIVPKFKPGKNLKEAVNKK